MSSFYINHRKQSRSNADRGAFFAVICLVATIATEAITMCAAAGGIWPIGVWLLFMGLFWCVRA